MNSLNSLTVIKGYVILSYRAERIVSGKSFCFCNNITAIKITGKNLVKSPIPYRSCLNLYVSSSRGQSRVFILLRSYRVIYIIIKSSVPIYFIQL